MSNRPHTSTAAACSSPLRPALPALLAALHGCALAEPPTCTPEADTACFVGAFRSLLGQPMDSVEVCTPDLPDVPCTTTGPDGTWRLPGLPRDTDVVVTASHEGTVETVFPQSTTLDWYDWYKVMVPLSIMNTNASNVGATLDPARGNILFIVWEGLNLDGVDTARVPDVTVRSLSGEGAVFYSSSIGLASAKAEATTSNGSGGVLNLTPGVHELEFTAPGGPCSEPMFHWSYTSPNVIPVPVLAGHTTAIDVLCPTQDGG